MNLNRLEYFLTLSQTGNLARASELLHISPRALSKAMKVLEDELEQKLWTRDGRKMILTDAGKLLLKKVPRLIEEITNLKESLNVMEDSPQTLRIGTFEVFSTYFLAFLKDLKWDKYSLELHEFLPGELERYIISGEIDFGITYMPIPNPDLDFIKIKSIEMGTFTRKGSFKDVHQPNLPFVIPVMPLQSVPTKVRGLDGWPEWAYRRKVLHKVTLMESALELCRQGKVAGYFPAFVVEEHNKKVRPEFQLERRPLANSPVCRVDVFIVKRKSYEENAFIRQTAKALRSICS